MDKFFKFTLPESVIRRMNRQQYKAAMQWLRLTARQVREKMDMSKIDQQILNTAIYGVSIDG